MTGTLISLRKHDHLLPLAPSVDLPFRVLSMSRYIIEMLFLLLYAWLNTKVKVMKWQHIISGLFVVLGVNAAFGGSPMFERGMNYIPLTPKRECVLLSERPSSVVCQGKPHRR